MVRAPGLRFQIVAGFCVILVLGAAASFFAVFRLAGQLSGLDGSHESRQVIEQSLDRLRGQTDPLAQADIGRETILELSRINARAQLAGRNLLFDTVGVFAAFLGIQLLTLALLSTLLSRALTRPMRRLLDGIHRASTAGPGFGLGRLGGREWDTIGQAFNQLQLERDHQAALLAEQSRLSGWQEVASFLAHQLKNPLTSINLALENLEALDTSSSLDPKEATSLQRENRAVIRQESQRLVELVRRFRASTSLPAPRLSRVPLAGVVEAARGRFDTGEASFNVDLPPDLYLRADAQLLEEAFVNLFRNSVQAWTGMESPVEIRVGAHEPGPDRGQEIIVSDSVTGVSPQLAATMLETPFSTKAGGSGLGLVFVRSVMSRHRGSLSVSLGPAGGLVFTLAFPREDHPWPAS